MSKLCVFIASSDNTADVLQQTLKSYQKYWKTSDLDRFVGLNNQQNNLAQVFKALNVQAIYSKKTLGWAGELKEQLKQLAEQYDFVLLILDDFFIKDYIDEEKITAVLSTMQNRHADYIRLIPKKGSIWFMICQKIIQRFSNKKVSQLYPYSPYYASLQMAIWRIDYLLNYLGEGINIWQFEHKVIAKSKHYCTNEKIVNYGHIVEKGKWFSFTPTLFKQHQLSFEKGSRDFHLQIKNKHMLQKYKFRLFGYGFLILKTWWKK